MATKDDGNFDMWVIGVTAATPLLGAAFVILCAWWWYDRFESKHKLHACAPFSTLTPRTPIRFRSIIGRNLRTHTDGHPCSEQVMQTTLTGETQRWQKEEERKRKGVRIAVPEFMPLGLRIESEIVCGQIGSHV